MKDAVTILNERIAELEAENAKLRQALQEIYKASEIHDDDFEAASVMEAIAKAALEVEDE